MAYYEYKCDNKECTEFEKEVTVVKSMNDSSRLEYCEKCDSEMVRIYSVGGIKTADGYNG